MLHYQCLNTGKCVSTSESIIYAIALSSPVAYGSQARVCGMCAFVSYMHVRVWGGEGVHQPHCHIHAQDMHGHENVCVCACMRACVRACVRVCVCVCVCHILLVS